MIRRIINAMPNNDWSADTYEKHARFVSDYGLALVDVLNPKPGERILDLGAGDGVLTQEIAARGAAVVGFDASPEFVHAGLAKGLDFRLGDAEALAFEEEFDAVFTNAALHWMKDEHSVAGGVYRALKPGERFVGEFGGHGNIAAVVVALHAVLEKRGINGPNSTPWYFPTAAEYEGVLVKAGFEVLDIALIPRPTILSTDMAGWLSTFAESFMVRLCPHDHAEAMAEAVDLLRPILCDSAGNWTADYVRLRFSAVK